MLAIHHPWALGKDGRRYLYYVCGSSSRFGASGQSLSRVPAVAVERAVVDQIRTVLTSAVALGRLSQIWEQLIGKFAPQEIGAELLEVEA